MSRINNNTGELKENTLIILSAFSFATVAIKNALLKKGYSQESVKQEILSFAIEGLNNKDKYTVETDKLMNELTKQMTEQFIEILMKGSGEQHGSTE